MIIMIAASKSVCTADETMYTSIGPFMFEEISDERRIFEKTGNDAYIIKPVDIKKIGDYSIPIKVYQLMKKLCMPFVIILISYKKKKQIGFIVPFESEDYTNDDIKEGLEIFENHKLVEKVLSVNEYMINTGEIGDICGYRVARGPIQEKQMRINREMIIE